MEEPFYYNNTKFILEVKDSLIPGAGLGLFTCQDIPADVLIGQYEGTLSNNVEDLTPYSFEVSPRYFIDAHAYPRCYIAMVNDARNSSHHYNCEFRMEYYKNINKRKILLYSIRDIKKGSELFANYGDDYWV